MTLKGIKKYTFFNRIVGVNQLFIKCQTNVELIRRLRLFFLITAPGFVTDIKVRVISSRSIQVTWLAAKDSGSGIIGHDVLYNRGDKPVIERLWKIHVVNNPRQFNVTLDNLLPNRPYEIKIYARSKETRGVPSQVVKVKTIEDGKTAIITSFIY